MEEKNPDAFPSIKNRKWAISFIKILMVTGVLRIKTVSWLVMELIQLSLLVSISVQVGKDWTSHVFFRGNRTERVLEWSGWS